MKTQADTIIFPPVLRVALKEALLEFVETDADAAMENEYVYGSAKSKNQFLKLSDEKLLIKILQDVKPDHLQNAANSKAYAWQPEHHQEYIKVMGTNTVAIDLAFHESSKEGWAAINCRKALEQIGKELTEIFGMSNPYEPAIGSIDDSESDSNNTLPSPQG
jgi:hypothetical protein